MTNAQPEHLELLLTKLDDAGATIERSDAGLRVTQATRARAMDFVTLPYPGIATDFQPILLAMLAVADGTSIVTENVFEGRFLYVGELQRMGADIRTEGHHAVIRGVPRLSAAPVRALDIRAGMALVIGSLVRGRGHRDLRRAPHRPRVRGPRRQTRSAGRRCPPRGRCGRRARPGGRPVIPQPPPGVEPAFTGMPAPTVDVPPRPDEPIAAGSGPQGLPAVDWSFPRALLVGLVTNLLLAQVVVGSIAFIALGITDVDDPKTIYAGLIGDVAWLGFMLIWLVRWHPDWRARIGVFGGRRGAA